MLRGRGYGTLPHNLSLRASSPIWASEARRACSQAITTSRDQTLGQKRDCSRSKNLLKTALILNRLNSIMYAYENINSL